MENKKKTTSVDRAEEALALIKKILSESSRLAQRERIDKYSPYSDKINKCINKYEELKFYVSSNLREAVVNRPTLIRDIDFDLWVSSKSKTNRQLMAEGDSPYEFDSPEGRIDIHHIGQKYENPFAELTDNEHVLYGNSKLLHDLSNDSWRRDKSLESQSTTDKRRYWIERSKNADLYNSINSPDEVPELEIQSDDEASHFLKEIVEYIFENCNVDDIKYFEDLSKSYSIVKNIGAKSIKEFLNNEKLISDNSEGKLVCPYCGSKRCVSNGYYSRGSEKIQRYQCNKCDKTFSNVHKSIISGSNLSFIDWLKLIDCVSNGYSTEKTAKICNLSEPSVQENKYKLFYALKQLDDQVKLYGNIVIDETYFAKSYKGNHTISKRKTMRRKAHKRGHQIHKRGTSKEQVCVICALDDNGNSVARVTGLGNPTAEEIYRALDSAIDKTDPVCLYTDKENALGAYANQHNYLHKSADSVPGNTRRYNSQKRHPEFYSINRYLQKMNSYHKRLKRFIDSFSGVSSRYIAGYAYLFSWKERNKNKDPFEAYKELLSVMLEPNLYLPIESIINGDYLPDPTSPDLQIDKKLKKYKHGRIAKDVWNKYAKGVTVQKIADEYDLSVYVIRGILSKCRELGIATKTEREKKKEMQQNQMRKNPYENNKYALLYKELYEAKEEWAGEINGFYESMAKKYGISIQTIKNYIAYHRRILSLQEAFYINQEFSYANLRLYFMTVWVYEHLIEAGLEGPFNSKKEQYEAIAAELRTSASNIQRISDIIRKNPDIPGYFRDKHTKLPKSETLARDRSVFVDFLKWSGTLKEFTHWAAPKYNVKEHEIYTVIRLGMLADPGRYNMI